MELSNKDAYAVISISHLVTTVLDVVIVVSRKWLGGEVHAPIRTLNYLHEGHGRFC